MSHTDFHLAAIPTNHEDKSPDMITFRIETTDGTLTDRQRAMTYGTPADAANALREHMGWEEVVLGERFPHDCDVDAWCAYETEEDADETGDYAPRVVMVATS